MSSDRGTTMHRGLGPSVDQQEPWAQPTAPATANFPARPASGNRPWPRWPSC